jgi:glycine/D-amino acid oxidase-like deaminating enzyme
MSRAHDVCIVGGGIVGLWVARELAAAGLDVVVVERARCGSGASGGILGALMAHAPDNWNAKKQFQFDALTELPGLITALEDETGLATGYARCGRIMPIRRPAFLEQARRRAAQSRQNWCGGGAAVGYDVVDAPPQPGWLTPDAAPLGVVRDGLAARVDPARYVAALQRAVARSATILEGWEFGSFDSARRRVVAVDGATSIAADQVVLAAGYATYPLLEPLIGRLIGGGVKGQAALFRCPEAAGQPMIYDDGVYVVPHDGGTCAVGSTSEKTWVEPNVPDAEREDYIERARNLCPPLRDAELLRRWAGVRPRCLRTDPVVGRLAPDSPVLVATGGYKITFGIAHRMARCIAEAIAEAPRRTPLPPSYAPAHHLEGSGLRAGDVHTSGGA